LLILDTNVVSELMRDTPSPFVIAWLDHQVREAVWMAAITTMELHHGIRTLPSGRRRDALRVGLDRLVAEKIGDRIAIFDDAAARATASITADRQRAGRTRDLRDSMIAGIVVATGASLATRNTRHFADLAISLIDPWATDPETA